jgi:GNAT superfamily N-acetyltransferase
MKITSARVETKAIQTRIWEESTHHVLVGKKIVGIVRLSKTQTTRNQVYAEFSSSKQTLTNFKKLLLPKRFTFIWVEIVKIQEHSRGRGYGSQIFDWMKATYCNTLIGLHPKEIAADYNINMILRFYKKQGFEISRFEYEWYSFLYLK